MSVYTQGITVDNIHFDIPLVSLKRSADFLDKFAERTEDGDLKRELIGVYYNFTLTVGDSAAFGDSDYNEFWNKMTEPVEFHDFCAANRNRDLFFPRLHFVSIRRI